MPGGKQFVDSLEASSGVIINASLLIARPVDTIVRDAVTGGLFVSTDSDVPAYSKLDAPTPWTGLVINPTYTDAGAPLYPAAWRLHPDGSVELRGALVGGVGTPNLLFTLPVAARPARNVVLTVQKTAPSPNFFQLNVSTAGLAERSIFVILNSGNLVHLDGTSFPTVLSP